MISENIYQFQTQAIMDAAKDAIKITEKLFFYTSDVPCQQFFGMSSVPLITATVINLYGLRTQNYTAYPSNFFKF